MVERGALGAWVPVVMDFGLARETGEAKGLTESGAVMGTPAYMSPEQARGDVRSLDRRTDVYSLGATLYDLLSGRPPFEDDVMVNLLLKVVDSQPRSLRSLDPAIPESLDLIVETCLRKEADRRYPTALALSEDLDRFLHAQKLSTRRLSLGYRITYLARKNRSLAVLALALLVSLLGFVGYGIRTAIVNRQKEALAAQRAALERQLGQDIKEIEWLLRTSYGLPLHDTALERGLVVQRMEAMSQRQHQLGHASVAPVHRALGLGRLALHDVDAAVGELQAAQRSGDDSPELHYALGRALGAQYQKRLDEARRSGEWSWVEKRRKELQAELLVPALASLEKSRGQSLQAPEYLQGLIALYRDQYDEAIAHATKAKQRAPWLFEAEELAGDAHAARGLSAKNAGKGAAARSSLQTALAHYQAAIAIGRSAGHLYEKAAEALLRQSEIDREQGVPVIPLLEKARELSEAAIVAAPSQASGYTKKAYALFHLSCAYLATDQNPEPLVKKLVEVGDKALTLDPQNGYALDAVGSALGCYGSYEQAKGRNPLPIWEDAMGKLRHAAEVLPHFPWAYNDYGGVFANYLEEKAKKEELQEAEVKTAERWILKATELDPAYVFPYSNLGRLYLIFASAQLSAGRDPRASSEQSLHYAKLALSRDSSLTNSHYAIAASHLLRAEYLLWSFREPSTNIEESLAAAHVGLAQNPKSPELMLATGLAFWIQSQRALQTQKPVQELSQKGRAALASCHSLHPPFPECWLTDGLLLLSQVAEDSKGGRAVAGTLAKAWLAADEAAKIASDYFDLHVLRAEIRIWRKQTTDLNDALVDVEKALRLQPRSGLPLALRGKILLTKGLKVGGRLREETMAQAASAFAEATKRNPLLANRFAAEIAQVVQLGGPIP